MKLRFIAVAVAALALTVGNAAAQDTSSEKGKLGYALGYDLGRNVSESGEQVDVAAIVKGLQDGHAKKTPAVPVDQLKSGDLPFDGPSVEYLRRLFALDRDGALALRNAKRDGES